MTSYIDNIKQIDFDNPFKVNSIEDVVNSLAQYFPTGDLFAAAHIPGTNLYRLLRAFAPTIIRYESFFRFMTEDYYIFKTVDLLTRWEQAVGIPDDCFKIDASVSLEQRRKQVICKLAIDNVITKDDYIALAAFFGATIRIQNGFDYGAFPYTFPFHLSGSTKESKFTLIITFIGFEVNGFPYTFPMTFTETPYTFLECLFLKIRPANVHIIYRYELT